MSTLSKEMSLWNLNDYTLQEIFDKVAIHLLTQNSKAIRNKYGSAAYHGYSQFNPEIPAQCAIGCLIPNDKYLREIEGFCVTHLLEFLELQYSNGLIKPLLSTLQDLHDHNDADLWLHNLKYIAKIYKLNILSLEGYDHE